jgi:transposase
MNKNMSIKEAGKKLGFKRSTAIMIVKKYRTKGYVTTFKDSDSKA